MIFKKKYLEIIPKKKNNKIKIITLSFFIFIFIFYGYKSLDYFIETNEEKKIIKEVSLLVKIDGEEKNIIKDDKNNEVNEIENQNSNNINQYVDFQTLKKINSDVVAFIIIKGTNINYPVVIGKDNDFYLHYNFYKEKNAGGWIFMDYVNNKNSDNKNTIIYGHNMKNGTMFGTLKNVLTSEWYNDSNNRYITYITENEKSIYEIFSIYEIKSENYYRKTSFIGGEFKRFLLTIKNRSIYKYDVDLTENDKILTLSTCATNNKYRLVVHAKKIN